MYTSRTRAPSIPLHRLYRVDAADSATRVSDRSSVRSALHERLRPPARVRRRRRILPYQVSNLPPPVATSPLRHFAVIIKDQSGPGGDRYPRQARSDVQAKFPNQRTYRAKQNNSGIHPIRRTRTHEQNMGLLICLASKPTAAAYGGFHLPRVFLTWRVGAFRSTVRT